MVAVLNILLTLNKNAMRKFYSLILLAIIAMMPQCVFAWSFELKQDNIVLDSVYNLRLYKTYDFFNGKCGYGAEDFFTDGAGNRVSGDGCFTLSPDKASIKLNKWDSFQVLQPVEMSNFYIGIGTGALNLRAGVNKDGLHNYGSGSRMFAIGDVKAGQIIVCQWGCTTTRGTICQPTDAISGADACTWTDITEDVHAAQKEAGKHIDWVYDEEEGEDVEKEVEGEADWFTYWRVESDGYFVIELQREVAVQGIQIWLDKNAEEAVSAPTMKMTSVYETSRTVELEAGASTLGSSCEVWYGLESEDALYLVETEEIVKSDTIYVKDIDGNDTAEIESIVNTYKKVLDPEEWSTGIAGSRYYDKPIEISDQDDEDEDGYVTINAATVSELGGFSDIVTFKVSVAELTLNAPAVTLVGLDGEVRQYKVSWANNTLCKEEYEVKVKIDGTEETVTDFETIYEAEETIGATAHVEGYIDGVLEEQDVMARGTAYLRKNAEKAEAGQHDWDFVNLTEIQYQMIRGEYSDTYVYVSPNEQDETKMDSIFYSRDEYFKKIEAGELQEGDGLPYNPIDCGWWYDASKSRATLNVIAPDTIFTQTGEVSEIIVRGKDPNANGYGYVDDSYVQLFNNGLSFSCPPNANNASCLFIYTNHDLGAYFMARPTLTFDREATKYGDYVLIYQGAGGSNYTNSRWPSLYEVPAEELLSVTLQSGGVHVFYIDVYTPEEAPEDPYTGVETVKTQTSGKNVIFDLSGRRVMKAEKGIYIVNGKKFVK